MSRKEGTTKLQTETFTSKEGYQFDFSPLQFIKVILKSLNEKAQKSTACLSEDPKTITICSLS